MESLDIATYWIWANFLIFLTVFAVAIYINQSFNIWLVGIIYILPLIPLGLSEENFARFLIQSLQNLVFGVIEIVIFVITVHEADFKFDRPQIKQFIGHVLPIAIASVGMSYFSRYSVDPVDMGELIMIMLIFILGSVLRVVAVYQLGAVAFKFDIVFREDQKMQTNKLYSIMRHPSYTAMIIVFLAYALTTHNWIVGTFGLFLVWFGLQYRIFYEEKALKKYFGEDYKNYQAKTGMWIPLLKKKP